MVAYSVKQPTLSLFDTFIDGILLSAITIHKSLKIAMMQNVIKLAAKKLNRDHIVILKEVIALQEYITHHAIDEEALHQQKLRVDAMLEKVEKIVATVATLKNESKELDTLYTTSLKLETELAFLQARL